MGNCLHHPSGDTAVTHMRMYYEVMHKTPITYGLLRHSHTAPRAQGAHVALVSIPIPPEQSPGALGPMWRLLPYQSCPKGPYGTLRALGALGELWGR